MARLLARLQGIRRTPASLHEMAAHRSLPGGCRLEGTGSRTARSGPWHLQSARPCGLIGGWVAIPTASTARIRTMPVSCPCRLLALLLVASAVGPAAAADPKPLNEKVKEIAGTAEFLRAVPKHF